MGGSGQGQAAVEPVFEDGFRTGVLDPSRWVDHYLPHWSEPERSRARYDVRDGILRLRIDADQPAWRPEDGELRVSNLQTGHWSGPVGAGRGQHRHRSGLTVRTWHEPRRLFTPRFGRVEATLRARIDPTTMLAFWMIGTEEESPDDSGEICVVELFGDRIGHQSSELSIGIKAHHDPRLVDDMAWVRRDLDTTRWHRYAAEWDPDGVRFLVDGDLVRTVGHRLDYPLVLMVDLFEFPPDGDRDPSAYPKLGEVASVRGWADPAQPSIS